MHSVKEYIEQQSGYKQVIIVAGIKIASNFLN